jgi:hypothetical protein
MIRVYETPAMASTTKMASGGDRDQQESALFDEDGPAFAPGQRTTQSNARSERRTEDMAQKDGQNRAQHDGQDAREAQLLPTVVHDQHSHQRDRRVDHSVHTDLQPPYPCLWSNRHCPTVRVGDT